jgi:hypothetical protein
LQAPLKYRCSQLCVLALVEWILARHFDNRPCMRYIMTRLTPLMACISQSGTRAGNSISRSDLPFATHYINTTTQGPGSEREFLSHSDQPCQLGRLFFLIDCKKIMPQLGGRQTFVREAKLNQELKARYADRPTAERGPFSRVNFRAKPRFTMPESSKNL